MWPELAAPTHLRAERATTPIVIDGKLDDRAWRRAHATSAFRQKVPDDGASPTEKTTIFIVKLSYWWG